MGGFDLVDGMKRINLPVIPGRFLRVPYIGTDTILTPHRHLFNTLFITHIKALSVRCQSFSNFSIPHYRFASITIRIYRVQIHQPSKYQIIRQNIYIDLLRNAIIIFQFAYQHKFRPLHPRLERNRLPIGNLSKQGRLIFHNQISPVISHGFSSKGKGSFVHLLLISSVHNNRLKSQRVTAFAKHRCYRQAFVTAYGQSGQVDLQVQHQVISLQPDTIFSNIHHSPVIGQKFLSRTGQGGKKEKQDIWNCSHKILI